MGRKKFGWKDALSLTASAAGVASNFTNPTKVAGKAGEAGNAASKAASKKNPDPSKIAEGVKADRKPFKDVESDFFKGNATNLKGAQGGVSNPALRNAQQNTGQSALVKARKDIT